MADSFAAFNEGLESPVRNGATITPNDLTDLAFRPRAIYVGSAGDLALTLDNGNVTLIGVAAGSILPIRPTRVLATGTTAGSIVALW